MDHADHMRESIDIAVAAIRGADPARYGDPTPCTDWTVGKAVNHLAFGLVMAEYGARKAAWPSDWTEDERCPYLRGVPEAEWADRAAEAGAAAARAWQDPAAWEGDAPFGSGSMPAAAIGSMMTAEFVLHGWDVARATGQPFDRARAAGRDRARGRGVHRGHGPRRWLVRRRGRGARGRADAGPGAAGLSAAIGGRGGLVRTGRAAPLLPICRGWCGGDACCGVSAARLGGCRDFWRTRPGGVGWRAAVGVAR